MKTTRSSSTSNKSILCEPLELPISHRIVPNRLVKAATTEGLADPHTHLPTAAHYRLYERWTQGGSGMILTGNVMVDRRFMEEPRNVVLDEYTTNLGPFATWAAITQISTLTGRGATENTSEPPPPPLAIMQISHCGRQSPVSVTGWFHPPAAPTGGLRARLILPGAMGQIMGALFTIPPRTLRTEEVPAIVQQFATTAHKAEQAGWDGVEIHAAHGYLLSQFLSPAGNFRTDEYGGSAVKRRKLLMDVIAAIRQVTSEKFVLGVKINAKDKTTDGIERETECLELIVALCELEQLDFIELSGGTYEDSIMVQNVPPQDDDNDGGGGKAQGGCFFESFAQRLQQYLDQSGKRQRFADKMPRIMLTGGFRTAVAMERAIQNQWTDLIGLCRPLCTHPNFARELLEGQTLVAPTYHLTVPIGKEILETALNNLWYQRQLERLSQGLDADPDLSIVYTLTVKFFVTYIWDWKASILGKWWFSWQNRRSTRDLEKED